MSKQGDPGERGSWRGDDGEAAIRRFHALVDVIDDGLYQLDEEGRFVAVNDVLVERLGHAREELVGEHVSLVLADDDDVERVTDDVERATVDLERAADDPTGPGDGDVVTLEVPLRTASGDVLDSELRVSRHVVDGEFRGTVGLVRGVTPRRSRTAEEERTLLNRVFEASPIGITALAPDGEIITLNDRAAEMVGSDPDGRVGETYDASEWDVYDAVDEPIPPAEQPFARVVDTGEPVIDFEARVRRPDGDDVWLSFNAVPVFDDDGDLSMVVLTYEDITERTEHEQDLEQERAQTEQLLQTAPIAIAVQDAEGETILANQRAQDALGLSEQEILDEPEHADEWTVSDAAGEELPSEETPTARALASGEPVFDEEIVIEPPDGEAMWFRINAAPVFGADGDLERVVSAGEDITELKEREQQLERRKSELETELSEILGRVSDAFYALDEEFRFTHLNERAAEIMQHSVEELQGRSVWEVFPDAEGGVFWEEFHAAMETQEPVSFEYHAVDLDAWLEFNVYPSETGLSIYFQEVTDRVESEWALEESERRYRTLVENFPNGAVGLFDEDLRYTVAGGESLRELHIPMDEIVGSSIYERYPEDIVAEIEPKFRAVFEGESSEFEIRYHDRDLSVHTLPVEDSEGEVFAGMLMVQDVSERKEYQRQLEESNERLEQFAYAASHDLQEPLRMVSSYLQLIEKRYEDELDEEGREFLEFAVDGAERMREMVNALLQYSRVDTAGEPLEPLALDEVLEEARENLAMQITERNADVTVDPLPRARGDAAQLRQVFQNLLSNAIEYSDGPPRVHVSAERREAQSASDPSGTAAENDGDVYVVSVSDEGVGIDPEHQERIFDVFQRLHGRDEHPGTGIGLALAERIVERHGGDIRVDSTPGEGSTFSVVLPASPEETDD